MIQHEKVLNLLGEKSPQDNAGTATLEPRDARSAPIYGVNCRPARTSGLPPKPAGPGDPLAPGFCRQSVRFVHENRGLRNFPPSRGRPQDVLRWVTQGEKPVAELEIYRAGGESSESGTATAPPSVDGGDRRAEPKPARRAPRRLRGSLGSGAAARCWFPCNFQRLATLLCDGVAQLTL
jgi:hypothetical protein